MPMPAHTKASPESVSVCVCLCRTFRGVHAFSVFISQFNALRWREPETHTVPVRSVSISFGYVSNILFQYVVVLLYYRIKIYIDIEVEIHIHIPTNIINTIDGTFGCERCECYTYTLGCYMCSLISLEKIGDEVLLDSNQVGI